MKEFSKNKLATNPLAWGPALVFLGIYILVFSNVSNKSDIAIRTTIIVLCSLISVTGIFIMFRQLRTITKETEDISVPEASKDLEHAITQLSKNYEILRKQTSLGFLLSGLFMTLGFLVIIIGALGNIFGLSSQKSNLTSISGIILEFVSGTAMLIYRINFKQLNSTSEKLHRSWKYLTAFRKTDNLQAEKKDETIISLIGKFVEEK